MNIKFGQKVLYSLAALGILGFAAHGITNTVKAADDLSAQNAAGQTVLINQTDGISPDGAFCPPGGCAACAGCVSLQYQQSVVTLPSSVILESAAGG
jgi:hypothetical protein